MITVNITQAKLIAHSYRREARQAEFTPLDQQIQLQIPGTDLVEVEAKRQAIRDKYTAMQATIDNSTTAQELKTVVDSFISPVTSP